MFTILKTLWCIVWAVVGPVAFGFALYSFTIPHVSLTPVAAQKTETPTLSRTPAIEVRFEIQNIGWRGLSDAQLTCENDITRFDVAIDAPNAFIALPGTFYLAAGDSTRKSCYVRVSPKPITALLSFDVPLWGTRVIREKVRVGDQTVLYPVPERQSAKP